MRQYKWQGFISKRKGNNSIFGFLAGKALAILKNDGSRNVPDCMADSIGKICEEFINRILQFRSCLTPECIKRHSSTKKIFFGDEISYGNCGFNSRQYPCHRCHTLPFRPLPTNNIESPSLPTWINKDIFLEPTLMHTSI